MAKELYNLNKFLEGQQYVDAARYLQALLDSFAMLHHQTIAGIIRALSTAVPQNPEGAAGFDGSLVVSETVEQFSFQQSGAAFPTPGIAELDGILDALLDKYTSQGAKKPDVTAPRSAKKRARIVDTKAGASDGVDDHVSAACAEPRGKRAKVAMDNSGGEQAIEGLKKAFKSQARLTAWVRENHAVAQSLYDAGVLADGCFSKKPSLLAVFVECLTVPEAAEFGPKPGKMNAPDQISSLFTPEGSSVSGMNHEDLEVARLLAVLWESSSSPESVVSGSGSPASVFSGNSPVSPLGGVQGAACSPAAFFGSDRGSASPPAHIPGPAATAPAVGETPAAPQAIQVGKRPPSPLAPGLLAALVKADWEGRQQSGQHPLGRMH